MRITRQSDTLFKRSSPEPPEGFRWHDNQGVDNSGRTIHRSVNLIQDDKDGIFGGVDFPPGGANFTHTVDDYARAGHEDPQAAWEQARDYFNSQPQVYSWALGHGRRAGRMIASGQESDLETAQRKLLEAYYRHEKKPIPWWRPSGEEGEFWEQVDPTHEDPTEFEDGWQSRLSSIEPEEDWLDAYNTDPQGLVACPGCGRTSDDPEGSPFHTRYDHEGHHWRDRDQPEYAPGEWNTVCTGCGTQFYEPQHARYHKQAGEWQGDRASGGWNPE